MSSTGTAVSAGRGSWPSNVLLRTAAVVLLATTVPVASLIWASGVARAEVERRALEGLTATAKATVLQEQQAWNDAVRVVSSAASRPVPLSALQSGDAVLAGEGAQNILVTGPFADVRLYDSAGKLAAMAVLPDVTPTPYGMTGSTALTVGDPVSIGTRTTRQVAVPIGPIHAGRLVVDVDLTQLLGQPSDLGFGRTGVKFLVTSNGRVVAGSTAVGTSLRSAVNRSIVSAGQPTTKVVYSPFWARSTAESVEPIPTQQLSILVQQARSEVLGAADRLAARLRWAALGVAILGVGLALSLGIFLSRRSRRLADSEQRLADSEGESRQRFEQVLDAIPIGVFVTAPDGKSQYANREAERLLGQGIVPGARSDELGEIYQTFVAGTGEQYPAARSPLLRALGGEATHVDDMEIHRPDVTIPVEVWGTAVFGGDHSVEFGITAFADVSERRRATEQVQFLSAITASMSEGVALVRSADSSIAYANSSYEAMFGYQSGELVGRSVRDLTVSDAGNSEAFTGIHEAVKTNGEWRGEVHGLRKDGTTLWCAVNVAPLDHPTLGPGWIAVTSDITVRRAAQEAQARLASIVQASQEAILGKTLDGVVTSWNSGAETLFGYTALEMIGGPIEVLIPPEGRADEAQVRARVAHGLGVEHYETARIRKDGTCVDVSATLSPIVGADGRIVGIASICRDVTDRKRAEAALREREEQLAAARDQALEASRLKSQFLATMSHEIRTPMNGVLGMAQLVLSGHLEPEQRGRVTRLREAGQSLLAIIDDILDVSKMEAGKLEMEVADFDLFAAVESVVSLCSSAATDKGLILTLNTAPGVPEWVGGDSLRLRQVLLNIVGNAVKFTEQGGVDLTITRAGGPRLRFTVRDSGIGLDGIAKARVMEPFSQADSSTTRRFGGTGLGLAICRRLVDLMGGSLDFTSEPDVGSTFWFEVDLPEATFVPAAVAHLDDRPVPASPGPAHPGVVDGTRVLLVDDIEINRDVGKGLLESVGYRVDTVASGVEALDAVRQGGYAAVLMDCLMPVMDGYEASRLIRGLGGPAGQVPIIALTAAAMTGDRDHCLAAGMDDYVSKPVDLEQMMAALAPYTLEQPQALSGADEGTFAAGPPPAPEMGREAALVERLELIRRRLPADAFDRICRQFLSATPEMIARLVAAVGSDDAETARDVAHSLKGTVATMGAARLSALALRVEQGEAAGGDVLGRIQEEFDRARGVVISVMAATAGA